MNIRVWLPWVLGASVVAGGPHAAVAGPRGYAGPRAVAAEGDHASVPGGETRSPGRSATTSTRPQGTGLDARARPSSSLTDDGYDPLRHSPQALRARHFIRAGIVLLSAGVALGVGASVMAASDPCSPFGGNSCQEAARNRAAWTMGIPGMAMLAAGGAMLGVGLHQLAGLKASVGVVRGGMQAHVKVPF